MSDEDDDDDYVYDEDDFLGVFWDFWNMGSLQLNTYTKAYGE